LATQYSGGQALSWAQQGQSDEPAACIMKAQSSIAWPAMPTGASATVVVTALSDANAAHADAIGATAIASAMNNDRMARGRLTTGDLRSAMSLLRLGRSRPYPYTGDHEFARTR
jgi:hypothetical protein